jgi:hypothetical protein
MKCILIVVVLFVFASGCATVGPPKAREGVATFDVQGVGRGSVRVEDGVISLAMTPTGGAPWSVKAPLNTVVMIAGGIGVLEYLRRLRTNRQRSITINVGGRPETEISRSEL